MNKLQIFLIFVVFTFFHLRGMCQEIQLHLEWEAPKIIYQNEHHIEKALWFKHAEYIDNYIIPYINYNIGVISDEFIIQANIADAEYIPLSQEEQIIVEESGISIAEEVQLTFRKNKIKKEIYLVLTVLPIRKHPQTGAFEKLRNATIQITSEWQNVNNLPTLKSSKTTTSVLKEGNFYKLSVSTPGVYRIAYNDLLALGINPDNINPANIRLYGNGGQMLPEKNDEPRIDDIYENAIYVHGQENGTFDKNDYILFYASGPHKWIYNPSNAMYRRIMNIYEDKSYYFLTFDKGIGKRIETVNHMSESPSFQTDMFLDRTHYENQSHNLIKSGKEWFGDVFDIQLSQQFDFSFPNAISDSCVKIAIHMVARAPGPTSAIAQVGGTNTSLSFQGTTSYTSDYARESTGLMCVNNISNALTVSITYNKSTFSDAKAWLNYISVIAWRKLVMSANQLHFQNPSLVSSSGDFVRYNMQSVNPLHIWDITNPLEPKIIIGTHSGNTYSFHANADISKEFIATTGNFYHSVTFEGKVANQNLHGLPQSDYIIVSHPNFSTEAERLGAFHKQKNGLSYVVVSPQQIYNEFSSGSQDIAAIRDFIKMFYDRATDNSSLPKYLLFMGRASYDYKSRIQNNSNFVPTFQSLESLSPTKSYASDDFFGLLDDGEGFDCNGHLDIGIGRLPASNRQEAENMVAKIIRYHEKVNFSGFQNTCQMINNIPSLSDWRNIVTFIADDGDNNLHFSQAEGLANNLGNGYKHLNIDKIYLDAFPQISTSGGERAPTVNEAINKRVANGSLIVNYTGHGGEVGWAHERILELSDIQSWSNYYNMPLFITATCEFSRFDDPGRIAAGELVLLNPEGGGIGLFSTTRLAFSNYNESLNRSVYKVAFEKTNGMYPTLGEIFAFSKTDNNSSVYIRNFILLGDPAMRLAYPQHRIITTEINDVPVGSNSDTLSALSFVTVRGHIADDSGNKIDNFNGVLNPIVFDKPSKYMTLASNPSTNSPAPFFIQKNILYKGKVQIENGVFSFSFYVPKDINYAYGNGKISYYAENGETDATGYYNSFIIGGSSSNPIQDNSGPSISLYMNDINFVSGGVTDENPVLIALLSDKTGINTTGIGIGHDIIAVLNDNYSKVYVLNQYYQSDLNSYNSGTVLFPFRELPEGEHTLYFKAWDINNNSSDASLKFIVSKSHQAIIQKMFNYPNPFFDFTEFIFEHNQSCTPIKVTIDIYNVMGQHVSQLKTEHVSLGYKIEPIQWDGTMSSGANLPSGTYIYTLRLTTCEGVEAKETSKLVLIK